MLIAVPAAFLVATDTWRRVALIGVLVLLMIVELLNTAIEKLSDHVTPRASRRHRPHQGHGVGAQFDLNSLLLMLGCVLVCALLQSGFGLLCPVDRWDSRSEVMKPGPPIA